MLLYRVVPSTRAIHLVVGPGRYRLPSTAFCWYSPPGLEPVVTRCRLLQETSGPDSSIADGWTSAAGIRVEMSVFWSTIIPTVNRPTLSRAVRSVLDQESLRGPTSK